MTMAEAVMLRSTSLSVAKVCESPSTKWHLMKSADQHLGVPWIARTDVFVDFLGCVVAMSRR